MKRRTFHAGAAAAVGGATLARPSLVRAAADPLQIRLGYQTLYGGVGEVFETLRHTNILALHGIEAKFSTFTFGGPLAEAAVAGSIDNISGADAPVLRGSSRVPGTKIFQRTHDFRFAVIGRPDFEGGLAELKGKRLSGPFGTTVFPRSVRAIVAAGIKEPFKEIRIINQDIAEQADSLKSGLVDAVTTWDPTYERLLQQKIGKEIWTSKVGDGAGYQAVTGPWIKANGDDALVRLLKAWTIATWWTSNNLAQSRGWFGETSRLDASLVAPGAAADRYLRAPVKDAGAIDLTVTPDEIEGTKAVLAFLREQKLLTAEIDAAAFYDNGPQARAQKEIAAGDHIDLAKIAATS
ncbi:ABC transporter substrate-binding protein [Methylopila musalis]|uniref:ABC transporter substrate-binding protein n=1 Tax=Methylopila musalis TaxID=1134781 RepID=A0ABW3Z3C1_9HYPH